MPDAVDEGADAGEVLAGAAIALADAEATARAGAALAALVRGGDAIALVGELGAGKTALAAALAGALGAAGAASPTFALVHEYRGGRLIVWHADLYRIERAAELAELGFDEILGDPAGVCLVEWADRFPVLPRDHLRLELAHAAGGGRTLRALGTGPRGAALATGLAAALLP
jgi:tRNA threonylcarbamoyladenosine biosynthesis protein TsaE